MPPIIYLLLWSACLYVIMDVMQTNVISFRIETLLINFLFKDYGADPSKAAVDLFRIAIAKCHCLSLNVGIGYGKWVRTSQLRGLSHQEKRMRLLREGTWL